MRKVYEGVIEIKFYIDSYEIDDGTTRYDWTASNGSESDELFTSIEDAVYDVRLHFGD